MWTDYQESTRSQHWGVLRSFFSYLTVCRAIAENPILPIKAAKVSRDLVQGPYTDEQVDAIVASVANETAKHTWASEGDRVQLFLSLLLNTGCDVVDAVLHQPDRIKNARVGDTTVAVYRYKRRKTGVDGVIPLDAEVAHSLRSIPLVDGYSAGMPFRDKNPNLRMTCELWERRIKYCIQAAGVTEVVLPGLDDAGRPRTCPANVKQCRHTFAVRQLVAGQRPEDVARMLGHVSAEMVRRHYAPWVEALDEAYLLEVLKHR
jgi:integrase